MTETRSEHRLRRGSAVLLPAALFFAACDQEPVVAPQMAVATSRAPNAALSVAASTDRDILVALYEATDGPNWTNDDNWLTDAPLGEWHGVHVNAAGRVTGLELADNRLSGSIPAELGNLGNLRWLALYSNALSGTIPPELGGLVNLEQVQLQSNRLTGKIPGELGKLTRLYSVSFAGNELSGTIPLSFRHLSNMNWFHFNSNAGLCLPDALVPWYDAIEDTNGPVCPDREVLTDLYDAAGGAGWTNADGWLDDDTRLGEWYGVEVDSAGLVSTLDLQGNGLSGTLFGGLIRLAGLTTLRVGDNALSGRLPLFDRTPLQELRYANTELCESAESWFREWLASIPRHEGTGLRCPPLSDGEILAALYESTGGADWEESEGWLTDARLGEWFGVKTNADGRVVSLDLRWNGLSGPIPAGLGGLAELKTLILFRNDLTGPIPPALGGLAKAELVVLAGNKLSGPIPRELGGLASVEELYLNGNRLTSAPPELGHLTTLKALSLANNQLTSVPPELGELRNLESLSLNSNQLTSIPPELGGLAGLEYLGLWANRLTTVPPELGNLTSLLALDLDENRLTSVPRELGRLANLEVLWLCCNELTAVPAELGGLSALQILILEDNRLTGLPPGIAASARLAGAGSSVRRVEVAANGTRGPGEGTMDSSFAEFRVSPPAKPDKWRDRAFPDFGETRPSDARTGFGAFPSLWFLDLSSNEFSGRVPAELAQLPSLAVLELDGNRLTEVPRGLGGFASLAELDLSSNAFTTFPAELVELAGLESLGLADNADLAGALPLDMTRLEDLDDLHTTGTGLCAPADPEFLDWLEGVTRRRVALCDRGAGAAAYLVQAVQSFEFPVPLVAGEPALLRVFLTAARETGAGMPPVRAIFHRDGSVIHEVEIPVKSDPIPETIDEGSLAKSANAEIPGWVIQPGLDVVIEPDPDGTLDPALGVARRIPATGPMAVDVRAMPVFELTLVPFIWDEDPDSSIIGITAAMAADPEGHELLERTRLLLPVAGMDIEAHEPVTSPTNNGFEILELTEMIRVVEGGRGHFLGVMAGPTGPGGLKGVAKGIGSWSSFSILDAETIAHEFGHNRALYHAPACGAGGPDRYYPFEGNIGAWGYDFHTGELVPPDRWDFMSYCEPTWVSDYQFTNAVRYRLETETGSIVVAADSRPAATARTLLLWGGLDGEGAPHLRPAFLTDAPPMLPEADGAWSVTGRDPSGALLFSLSFDMAEFTDTDDERAGFAFALPVAWTGELASIALEGPGGSASLDRDTDDPMTILRDPATGRIRGILDGVPAAAAPGTAAAAAAGAQNLDILFSRGIPDAGQEQR